MCDVVAISSDRCSEASHAMEHAAITRTARTLGLKHLDFYFTTIAPRSIFIPQVNLVLPVAGVNLRSTGVLISSRYPMARHGNDYEGSWTKLGFIDSERSCGSGYETGRAWNDLRHSHATNFPPHGR